MTKFEFCERFLVSIMHVFEGIEERQYMEEEKEHTSFLCYVYC